MYRCLSCTPVSLAMDVSSYSSTFGTPSRAIFLFSKISHVLSTRERMATSKQKAAEIHMPVRK